MAFNNGGGSPWGNPRPGGPWGTPPPGPPSGGRGPGPDLDDLIRQAQDQVRRMLPGGIGGRGMIVVALLALVAWGASGAFRVQPDELGVVLRFGAYDRMVGPGLNYHIPWPVEQVQTPRVTRINRVDIGFRSAPDSPVTRPVAARNVIEESMMLTGDENIVDIDFAVFWRIRDAADFLFSTRNPEVTVKSASESMMREVIGRTPIGPALTEARAQIEAQVRLGTQAILDQYHAGVEITQVQLQKVDPPPTVIDAFRDVQRASADRERSRNQAEADRNNIIPQARGQAEQITQAAEGYRESQVARARGEAQRFDSVLSAYTLAQDITLRRMYLETMEDILRRNSKIVVDDRLQGVVPYLPLTQENQRPGGARPTPPASTPPPPLPAMPGRSSVGSTPR